MKQGIVAYFLAIIQQLKVGISIFFGPTFTTHACTSPSWALVALCISLARFHRGLEAVSSTFYFRLRSRDAMSKRRLPLMLGTWLKYEVLDCLNLFNHGWHVHRFILRWRGKGRLVSFAGTVLLLFWTRFITPKGVTTWKSIHFLNSIHCWESLRFVSHSFAQHLVQVLRRIALFHVQVGIRDNELWALVLGFLLPPSFLKPSVRLLDIYLP